MALVSDCCGYPAGEFYNDDTCICGDCKDHCGYEDDEQMEMLDREFSPAQQAIIDQKIAEEAHNQEGPQT